MSTNSEIILNQIVMQQQKELGFDGSVEQFFEVFSAQQVLKNYDLNYEEIQSGVLGNTLDGGIDGFYLFLNGELIQWNLFSDDMFDEQDDMFDEKRNDPNNIFNIQKRFKKNTMIEVIVIQSKFTSSFKEIPFEKLKTTFKNLLDLNTQGKDFSHRYNEDLLASFNMLKKIYLSLITKQCSVDFKIFYTSKGSDVHQNVKEQADELSVQISQDLASTSCNVFFYGAQELTELYQKIQNKDFNLNLIENPIANSRNSYIALCSLSELYKFITDEDGEIIKYIFESNVRDYQGRNNVNTDITDTLENNFQEEFWWLNNGITILSSQVIQKTNKLLTIQNPEIVNGLQTSSEIHLFFKKMIEAQTIKRSDVADIRNVLVRVIVPETEEVRDKIIKATNSQTNIPKSSLRATDPIHRQIEMFLKDKGVYYDRRKNYYKNLGKKPKEIISISFLSQCLISIIMQSPDNARARPSTLLDSEKHYNILFSSNTPLNTYYVVVKWGKKIEEECRRIEGLTNTQALDIKFHILYVSSVLICKNIRPSAKQIGLVSEKTIDSVLKNAVEITKKEYLDLGGNNKVVKGPELTQQLKQRLEDEIVSV